MVTLALATACLGHDDTRAAILFARVTAEHDVREVWLGLASARLRLGDPPVAADALTQALRRHVIDPNFAALADAIAQAAGAPGWCGMRRNGKITRRNLPLPSREGAGGRGPLLGFPIDTAAVAATVGCVTAESGTLIGWAWHPGDPSTDPVLTIRPATGRHRLVITATDTSKPIPNGGLLARPRGFTVPAGSLARFHGPLHVLGRDGKDLLGSPLDPRAELDANAAAASQLAARYPASHGRQRPRTGAAPVALPVTMTVPRVIQAKSARRAPAEIVIPVYGGTERVAACLDSVLAAGQKPIVIDDASPTPELVGALDQLARHGRIRLIRNQRNLGFANTADLGMRSAPKADIVLLNSDTLVAPGWLEELRSIAYGAPDIGTVTPLSNDATIVSYPNVAGDNEVPDLPATLRIYSLARKANAGTAVEIPVGVGFCLYIKRACLDAVGLFRADVFAQGYGEENDFCLRARHLGWRHVAAPGVFVAHVASHSFGSAGQHLRARNEVLLERMHPGYAELIKSHAKADPLAPARRTLDLARWRAERRRGSRAIVLITHAGGGGVERQIAASVKQHRAAGYRCILLRPSHDSKDGAALVRVGKGPTQVLVTVYQAPTASPESAPRLQVMRLGGEQAGDVRPAGATQANVPLLSAAAADVVIHVQRTGAIRRRASTNGPARAAAASGSRALA